jgi:hypothetical protein
MSGWSFGGIQYAPSVLTTYWSLSWPVSRSILCLRAVKVSYACGCVSFCRAWPPNWVKSVPFGMERTALSGRLLETRPGVCSRCTHVSVSQVGSWLVHEAPWWPWQGRGQKETCSCACLQLHWSIVAMCVFFCRVERRKGGWWWLVLDGPPSDLSMWSSAAGGRCMSLVHTLQRCLRALAIRGLVCDVVLCVGGCGCMCVPAFVPALPPCLLVPPS